MKIVKLFKISDFITFLNIIAGLLSIFFSILNQFRLAAILLILAVFFDYFDGKSAKKRNIANEFGKELDSLADIISFGVLPCIFVFMLFQDTVFIIVYILFLLAGVTRLARFNIQKTEGYFEGLPITINGIMIPILFFFNSPAVIFYSYLLLSSFLMISTIKVKKL